MSRSNGQIDEPRKRSGAGGYVAGCRAQLSGRSAADSFPKAINRRMNVDAKSVSPDQKLNQVEPAFAQFDLADERLRTTKSIRELLLGPPSGMTGLDEDLPQFPVRVVVARLPHGIRG